MKHGKLTVYKSTAAHRRTASEQAYRETLHRALLDGLSWNDAHLKGRQAEDEAKAKPEPMNVG